MTPEEIEAKRLTDEQAKDPLAERDAEIAKLREERDNYKAAALQRRGKFPADSEVLGEDFESFMEDKIKSVLADKEITKREQEKADEIRRITRENAELKLALKNSPGSSIGGDSGSSSNVKDNDFSPAQLEALKTRALRVKADPEKFIQAARDNLRKRS